MAANAEGSQVQQTHSIAELEAELARRTAERNQALTERDESLARESAAAEVLQVINTSPGDLAPVFDAMLEKAIRLCGAAFGMLHTFDGEFAHPVAARNVPTPFAGYMEEPIRPDPERSFLGRAINERRTIHVADNAAEEPYRTGAPLAVAAVDLGGIRTLLHVPLIKSEVAVGLFTIFRQEVRPFADRQIALLQSFATQAVIAMENARLLGELRQRTDELEEALEQQTATAEVLGVINSSPGDLTPVFEAILEKAHNLCTVSQGSLAFYDGEYFRAVAVRSYPARMEEAIRQPFRANVFFQRLVEGERFVQIDDVREAADQLADSIGQVALDHSEIRTWLAVPLRKEGVFLGHISAARSEVRPFNDKEIAVLEGFAAQAVIAMENARLINETREALEQQTATAEVLGVINSSPGDLTPVFDTILEKAHALCGAATGSLQIYDGEFVRAVATRGLPDEFANIIRQPRRSGSRDAFVSGAPFVQITDLADPLLTGGEKILATGHDIAGVRTYLRVPLRRDDTLVGFIGAGRREVRPFTDKQITLLQNFAAQAVIAMENARLITETREALEQQTATAEVLGVINASPGDLAPVFDAMLERATRLCEAHMGVLWTYHGDQMEASAILGASPEYERFLRQGPRPLSATHQRLRQGEPVIHIPDLPSYEGYRAGFELARALVDLGNVRAIVLVPLCKEGTLLGAFCVYRRQAGPFTDTQIALLENFAAQAVIAMENARLITETREALEQQTATAEVLAVINSSPGDLAPVFDAMLQKAMHLCDAAFGILWMFDRDHLVPTAMRGVPAAFEGHRFDTPPGPGTAAYRFLSGERSVIQNLDLADEEAYRTGDPVRRALVDLAGARSALHAPLCKDNAVLGIITIYRQEVRPFSDKQIALLQNFAAQAVIAIENARLLDEIRQRQAELQVTFDNMVDGVAMFDQDLRLIAWNRNFQQIADLSDDLLAQRPTYPDYLRILTERGELDISMLDEELSRRLEHTDQELRLERTRPNGRVIEVRRNAVPDGGFVLIYSDITERKRSEAEIRTARDAAEAAYRDLQATQASLIQAQKMAALGQLTAGIAHEIKNPLNFVNNFASLSTELLDELKEDVAPALASLDENKREDIDETFTLLTGNLDKIVEHGQRADNIVKSMLEHSRGVSGERREVDLNGVIEEALNLAYHGARAQDQGFNITLERDFEPSLKPIELAPQEMTRVFLNLFGNGFYATSKRARDNGDGSFRPVLTVRTREAGDGIEVRVRDNGTGIPTDIKDKLFQPFFTTKPTGEGTGLGLSISYDIVTQQHGGTITVESEEGAYTEFTLRLPRR